MRVLGSLMTLRPGTRQSVILDVTCIIKYHVTTALVNLKQRDVSYCWFCFIPATRALRWVTARGRGLSSFNSLSRYSSQVIRIFPRIRASNLIGTRRISNSISVHGFSRVRHFIGSAAACADIIWILNCVHKVHRHKANDRLQNKLVDNLHAVGL